MRAASASLLTGRIRFQLVGFIAAQLVLHIGFGAVVWAMAIATTAVWRNVQAHFLGLTAVWFSLLTGGVLAYNATWFPRTGSGEYYHDLAMRPVGPFAAGQVLYCAVVALALAVVAAAAVKSLARAAPARHNKALIAGAASGLLALASLWASGINSAEDVHGASQRPNVILLGIDSLRLDHLRRFGGTGTNSRHIDEFIATSDIVPDTTTPVARTYPSWVAILTGRSPRTTGAIFNLLSRERVAANPTLADVLRGVGYRTVYATDEVRFANIDRSYGFDQVVTPPIGAADFILGNFNDLPLVSVVANTRLGQWLFPFSHGNRGAAILFQPETFLTRLDREIEFNGPTFVAIHLTAAHWPYYVSSTPRDADRRTGPQDRPLYEAGLATADAMFGRVVQILKSKGALENSIVVVLSDHGEALALPSDSLVDLANPHVSDMLVPPSISNWGHGQSVLSPVQYQVLLSFSAFGDAAGFESAARTIAVPGSVEDIAPTIMDLLRIPAERLHATGYSLAPVLRNDAPDARQRFAARIRYTETDLRVMPGAAGDVDEAETAKQNSVFFQVDASTGRLHLRQEAVPLLMQFKERAAFDDRRILACLPAAPETHQYLLLDRKTGAGRLLTREPEVADAEARPLWDALHTAFSGELKPPVTIRPEDLPAFSKSWNDLLASQHGSILARDTRH